MQTLLVLLFTHKMSPGDAVLRLAVKQISIMTNITFTSPVICQRIGWLLYPIFTAGQDYCKTILYTESDFPHEMMIYSRCVELYACG